MTGATKILGAEMYALNLDNAANPQHYVSELQVPYNASTGTRAKLYKTVVSNLGATDMYLWIFDLAAGASTSVTPRIVELCPAGVCTTLDLSGGKPFYNGIFMLLSSTAPANPTTQPALMPPDSGIIDVDYRLE